MKLAVHFAGALLKGCGYGMIAYLLFKTGSMVSSEVLWQYRAINYEQPPQTDLYKEDISDSDIIAL